MSQENVEVVRQALDAMNRREIDRYLGHCTQDIVLRAPTGPIEGEYRGSDGIRRYFAAIDDVAPDFRLDADSVNAVDDSRVIGRLRVTATGRASGVPIDLPVTTVYELVDGKISCICVFRDHDEALKTVGLEE
jgi:ketosteroid isomerase-like protein